MPNALLEIIYVQYELVNTTPLSPPLQYVLL